MLAFFACDFDRYKGTEDSPSVAGTAEHAGLWGGAAWTAERSDFSQVTFWSLIEVETRNIE